MAKRHFRSPPETTEITVHLHRQTDKAIHVSLNGKDGSAEWLPKSQITYDERAEVGSVINVEVPVWLAERTGLV